MQNIKDIKTVIKYERRQGNSKINPINSDKATKKLINEHRSKAFIKFVNACS